MLSPPLPPACNSYNKSRNENRASPVEGWGGGWLLPGFCQAFARLYYLKKKKKLHHSSHIRLIRWTQPVSRDIGEHN